jgi:hypothetical protein
LVLSIAALNPKGLLGEVYGNFTHFKFEANYSISKNQYDSDNLFD